MIVFGIGLDVAQRTDDPVFNQIGREQVDGRVVVHHVPIDLIADASNIVQTLEVVGLIGRIEIFVLVFASHGRFGDRIGVVQPFLLASSRRLPNGFRASRNPQASSVQFFEHPLLHAIVMDAHATKLLFHPLPSALIVHEKLGNAFS